MPSNDAESSAFLLQEFILKKGKISIIVEIFNNITVFCLNKQPW